MAGSGSVAAASAGGIDWPGASPAEPNDMKRATYEDEGIELDLGRIWRGPPPPGPEIG